MIFFIHVQHASTISKGVDTLLSFISMSYMHLQNSNRVVLSDILNHVQHASTKSEGGGGTLSSFHFHVTHVSTIF